MHWLAIISACFFFGLWGFCISIASKHTENALSVQLIYSITNVICTTSLVVFLLSRKQLQPITSITNTGILCSIFAGVCGVLGGYSIVTATKATANPGFTNFLINVCAPLLTMFLTFLFLNEKLSVQTIFGVLLMIAGIMLTVKL